MGNPTHYYYPLHCSHFISDTILTKLSCCNASQFNFKYFNPRIRLHIVPNTNKQHTTHLSKYILLTLLHYFQSDTIITNYHSTNGSKLNFVTFQYANQTPYNFYTTKHHTTCFTALTFSQTTYSRTIMLQWVSIQFETFLATY